MVKNNVLLLVLNQLLTRVLTFVLNILTVRYVGVIAFGISSIHLYLLYTTILFLCREPFRLCILQHGFQYGKLQRIEQGNNNNNNNNAENANTSQTKTTSSNDNDSQLKSQKKGGKSNTRQAIQDTSNGIQSTSACKDNDAQTQIPNSETTTTTNQQLQDANLYSTMKTIFTVIMSAGVILSIALGWIYIQYPPDLGQQTTATSTTITKTIFELASPEAPLFVVLLSRMTTFIHKVLFDFILKLDFDALSIDEYYSITVCLFITSALIELSSEHLALYTNCAQLVKFRVMFEGAGNIAKCIMTYFVVVLMANWGTVMNSTFFKLFQQFTFGLFNNVSPHILQQTNVLNVGTALLAYGIGQLCYSIVVSMGYFGYYLSTIYRSKSQKGDKTTNMAQITSIRHILPFLPSFTSAPGVSPIDFTLLKWYSAFLFQTILKHCLTEGEKMLLVTLSPLSNQENGEYALVLNLGGLFTRMIFQPIEENCYTTFAHYHRNIQQLKMECSALQYKQTILNDWNNEKTNDKKIMKGNDNNNKTNQSLTPATHDEATTDNNNNNDDDIDQDKIDAELYELNRATLNLEHKYKKTVLLSTYIGLILTVFGTSMSYTLIHLLYGAKWSLSTNVPSILAMYCCAQVFFSLNGVLESFLYSTMSNPAQLLKANVFMVACNAVYFILLIVNFWHVKFDLLSNTHFFNFIQKHQIPVASLGDLSGAKVSLLGWCMVKLMDLFGYDIGEYLYNNVYAELRHGTDDTIMQPLKLPNTYILIITNIIIMTLRIAYSLRHVKQYFMYYYKQDNVENTIQKENKKNETQQGNVLNMTRFKYSFPQVLKWHIPQVLIRIALFITFIYNNVIVTFFLYKFSSSFEFDTSTTTPLFTGPGMGTDSVNPAVLAKPILDATLEAVQKNSTDSNHLSSISSDILINQWNHIIYNTVRPVARGLLLGYQPPRMLHHFMAIGCVFPPFLVICYLIYKVEKPRMSLQEVQPRQAKNDVDDGDAQKDKIAKLDVVQQHLLMLSQSAVIDEI